uniref:Probable DNA-directed RNA polymerases I, II, and III subunit RPABC3 n=2 Tax=Timema TaxID=61471 RepID=A0A7R9CI95_TIMCR|nr:unnamed protein product [Timema cristinae]
MFLGGRPDWVSERLSSLSQDLNLCLLVNNYRELSANHALARTLVSLTEPLEGFYFGQKRQLYTIWWDSVYTDESRDLIVKNGNTSGNLPIESIDETSFTITKQTKLGEFDPCHQQARLDEFDPSHQQTRLDELDVYSTYPQMVRGELLSEGFRECSSLFGRDRCISEAALCNHFPPPRLEDTQSHQSARSDGVVRLLPPALLRYVKGKGEVSRLHCESESFKMDLILDVNTWLYPMDLGDKFRLVLATTLREDGYPDSGEWNPMDTEGSRADSFEYVMYGKIYRIEGDESALEPSSRLAAYVSYGGLLMRLQGDANNLHGFEVDQHMYLLMKKLAF